MFLELGRFTKTENELVSPWDKWMYLFKNLGKMTSRPEMFAGREFNHLFKLANFCTFTSEEYQEYQQHEIMEYDFQNCLDYRYKEGINVGMERGILKGIEQGRMEGISVGMEKGMEKKGRI
ncbi:MAG: PD-(D/E)XK nuclease family transposase [Candidatus Cryptobacteroides sp.]